MSALPADRRNHTEGVGVLIIKKYKDNAIFHSRLHFGGKEAMLHRNMKMHTQGLDDEDRDEREYQRQKRRQDRSRNEIDRKREYKRYKQTYLSKFDDMDDEDGNYYEDM